MKRTHLRMLIKQKGFTQRELANKLGLSFVTMYQKLDNPVKFTHIERRKLARILNVKLEEIS